MTHKDKKVLVAFFSHTGQNYSNGNIIDLKKGNTAVAAEKIANETGAELFEIKTVKEYSNTYSTCVEEAKIEFQTNARPQLLKDIDVTKYDIVFLGFPNWCGTMPRAMYSFLEGKDFSGKIIYPFCTNEGSGMGRSEEDLKTLLPSAIVKKGLPIHGSSVDEADELIHDWIAR